MEPISDERLKELVAKVLTYDEVSGGAVIDSTVRAARDVESHFIAMELLAARARILALERKIIEARSALSQCEQRCRELERQDGRV